MHCEKGFGTLRPRWSSKNTPNKGFSWQGIVLPQLPNVILSLATLPHSDPPSPPRKFCKVDFLCISLRKAHFRGFGAFPCFPPRTDFKARSNSFRGGDLGWPRSTVEKGPQSDESYEGKHLKPYHFNRTLGAQRASSKYCQTSTAKQRELWEQNGLQPYPCNRAEALLRGPAAILLISRDTCSDGIAKLFRACFLGVSHNYRAICCKMVHRTDVPVWK